MSLSHTRLLRPTVARHRRLKQHARRVRVFNLFLTLRLGFGRVIGEAFKGLDSLLPLCDPTLKWPEGT